MRRKIKAWLYGIIRPLFVQRIDRNEDFLCCQCLEPVLRRDLFCSRECYEKAGLEPW